MGVALRSRGHAMRLLTHYAEAAAVYERAIEQFHEAAAPLEAARTVVGLIDALMYVGRHTEALDLAAQARTVLRNAEDTFSVAKLEMNVGNISFYLGDPSVALRYYRRAHRAFARLANDEYLAAAEANIGNALSQLDRFDAALRSLERSRRRYLQLGQDLMVATLDLNMGYVWSCRGVHLTALDHLLRARRALLEQDAPADAALANLNVAQNYLALHMLPEAIDAAREAGQLARAEGMPREQAQALVYEAEATAAADPHYAAALLKQARSIFEEVANAIWTATIDLRLAELTSPEEALLLATRALETFSHLGLARRGAETRLVLARAYERLGDQGQARDHVDHAHATALNLGLDELRFRSLHALARLDRSLPLYLQAADHVELLRRSLGERHLKMAFARAAAALHEEMIELLLEEQRPIDEVFLAVEAARARSLADEAICSSPRDERKRDTETDVLRERVRALQMRLRQAEMEGQVDEAARLHEEAAPLERALLARIHESEIARAASGQNPVSQVITIAELGTRVNGAILLEYFTIRDTIQALRVDRNQATVYRDLAAMGEVEETVRKLYFQLNLCPRRGENWVRQHEDALLTSIRAYLRRLHDLLVAPLDLPETGELVIVPTGVLHEIPFSALYDGQTYLGETHGMVVTPSAAIWVRHKEQPGPGPPLIMGAPDTHAPLVDEEAREVAHALGVRAYVGAAARREVFIRQAPTARLIHLAAHATVRGDNPRFSSIHFDDGPLAIHDLDGLRFQAELAVLSACSTAAGTRQAGDETLSLARSFLGAGAHNVLVSLWPVWDRSTRATMAAFYRELAGGARPAAALRLAQAETRESYPHPYYWAPFVLVG